MALKLVIMLAQENGVFQIQIYGDSLLLVQWMGREFNLFKFTLQPLFHDILLKKSSFSYIYFIHIYMDMKYEIDNLSKDGVALENGI